MDNKTLFIIALKNLKRHVRRTTINVVSVAITVGIMFFFLGYYRGTYISIMRESFIKYKSGHIQIHSVNFNDKKIQDYVTKDTVIGDYPETINKIRRDKDVTAASGRLIGAGFAGNGQEKMVVMITGVEPRGEKDISVADDYIKEGAFLDKSDGILIGKKTAELFGLKLGDLCYVQAQTVNNTPNLLLLPVSGIYETGFYELDKNTVFISLKNANLLFDTGNSINKIIVMLKDMKLTDKAAARLGPVPGAKFDLKTWKYYGQGLLENERGDSTFYAIFLTILIFIGVSTIMSTMYVNVYERIREIGTLRAIGWERPEVFKLFLFESLCIGIIGSLSGLILGGIPTLYLKYVGIEYSKMGEFISLPIFKLISKPEYYDIIFAFCTGVISTYLGGLLPARKASNMIVVEALRVL